MEIKNETIVTCYDAKKVIRKREKETELNYEQRNALDYLNKFCRLPEKNVKELVESLSKIEKLQDKHIVAVVDLMPRNEDDLRLLFANERIVLEDSEKSKILSAVKAASK